jgi:hypothetical protein
MENNELKDIEYTCRTCGKTFVHTVRDQEFYKQMDFKNEPKDCVPCRKAKKEARRQENNNN